MHSKVGLSRKKYINPLESSQRLRLLNTYLVSSIRNVFSLCSRSILYTGNLRSILYTGNTRLGINTWIDTGIMLDNLNIYF